jgi:hypothetical protein
MERVERGRIVATASTFIKDAWGIKHEPLHFVHKQVIQMIDFFVLRVPLLHGRKAFVRI